MNVIENTDLLCAETLMHVVNHLSVFPKCDRQWEDKFGVEGAKVGDSIRIRKPVNFDIREGMLFSAQPLQDPYLNFGVDQHFGVDFEYDVIEKTLSLDRISERYLQPLGRRIANEVDVRVNRTAARGATNFFGTPGTNPTSVATYQSAMSQLKNLGVPKSGFPDIVQTPDAQQAVVTDLRGLIEPGGTIAKQNLNGAMYRAFGANWDYDQNLYVHTTGAATGSGLISAANQSGASVTTDDWTASTAGILKNGDKLNFPGCYAVNPVTGAPLGFLRTFTVTADVDSDGAGAATVPIDPAIVLTGPYKNVSASPDNDGGVQLFGHVSTYASKVTPMQLVIGDRKAIAVAVVGLEKPTGGVDASYKSDDQAGISILMTRQFDINTFKTKVRADVLIGIKVVLPDMLSVVPCAS